MPAAIPVLILGAFALLAFVLRGRAHAEPLGDDPIPPSEPISGPVLPPAPKPKPAPPSKVPLEVAIAVRDMANNEAGVDQLRSAAALAERSGYAGTAAVMRQTADAKDELARARDIPESVAQAIADVADGKATVAQLRQAASDADNARLSQVAAMLFDRATFLETGRYASGPTDAERQEIVQAVRDQVDGKATAAQLADAARTAERRGLPKTARALARGAVAARQRGTPAAPDAPPGAVWMPWPPRAQAGGPDVATFDQVRAYAGHYRDRVLNASWAAAATALGEAALRLYQAVLSKLAEPPPGGSWTPDAYSRRMGEYRQALAQADAKAVEAAAVQSGAPAPGDATASQIARLRAGSPAVVVAPDRPLIRRGSRGAAVLEAQSMLKAAGAYAGKVDGDFGPATERAVKAFQQGRSGPNGKPLSPDGTVGPATWWALYQATGGHPGATVGEHLPSSPWPDVTGAQWARFVRALEVQEPGQVTARGGLGAFLYDPRRLESLGLMTNLRAVQGVRMGDFLPPLSREKFLDSRAVQVAVLARDLRRMRAEVEQAHGGQIGTAHEGRPATLSGLLALAHTAGPLRAVGSWLASADGEGDKARYPNTTAAYLRATGIF